MKINKKKYPSLSTGVIKAKLIDDIESSEEHREMYAGGGTAANPTSRVNTGWGRVIAIENEEERQEMAEGGEVKKSMIEEIRKRKKMADGGSVDIEKSSQEEPNQYYKRNEEILKENYDEGLMDMDQPEDSNLIGDLSEEDELDRNDMVSRVRKKIKSRKA